jgi:hypothetical protein
MIPHVARLISFALQLIIMLVASAIIAQAVTPVIIDFEGLSDSTPVTDQYPNTTFANATAITAGVSLNEFEFPPHSGSNVVFDDGGAITITFATPVTSFSGYFDYSTRLTLVAFDTANNPVTTSMSAFNNNLALSGDPGSSPNEVLSANFAGGIARVTITGNLDGGSFTLDDITTDQQQSGDTTPPTCTLTAVIPGPPGQVQITAQDTGSGLLSIVPIIATNMTVNIPPFSPGVNFPIGVTATKNNQSQTAVVVLQVTDVAGNSVTYSVIYVAQLPVVDSIISESFFDIPQEESFLLVKNGSVGLQSLQVNVNGQSFALPMKDNQEVSLNIRPFMSKRVNNLITFVGVGLPGASALILMSDRAESVKQSSEVLWTTSESGLQIKANAGGGVLEKQ